MRGHGAERDARRFAQYVEGAGAAEGAAVIDGIARHRARFGLSWPTSHAAGARRGVGDLVRRIRE